MTGQTLSELPDATECYIHGIGVVTVGEIRGERVRFITTTEASRLFSYAPETWSRWAQDMPGAFKDRLWRLPLAACEAKIERLSQPQHRSRGPWKRAATRAQAGRARPSHLPEG